MKRQVFNFYAYMIMSCFTLKLIWNEKCAASVFGETKKLEPMPADKKARWRKEVEWLLSVTDHIVELVPSQQQASDGSFMEVILI